MKRIVPILMLLCFVFVGVAWLFQTISATRAQEAGATAPTPAASGPSAERRVRQPAVAGSFYPGDAAELRAAVDGYLQAVPPREAKRPVVAAMCPHAGYEYSAPVAAHVYAAIRGSTYDTVVVIGTSHRQRFAGAALPEADAWLTPLGEVPVDTELRDALVVEDGAFYADDGVHQEEHSLEVQLPFLQAVLTGFRVLPVLVGSEAASAVATVSTRLASALQGKQALIIASSDMSHYPAYDDARSQDQQTLALIEQWENLKLLAWEQKAESRGVPQLACALCGAGAVVAAMDVARRLGANTTEVLKYQNSGDTPAGDKSRCVGYGAVVFEKVDGAPEPKVELLQSPASGKGAIPMHFSDGELSKEQQEYLLGLARETVNAWVGGEAPSEGHPTRWRTGRAPGGVCNPPRGRGAARLHREP